MERPPMPRSRAAMSSAARGPSGAVPCLACLALLAFLGLLGPLGCSPTIAPDPAPDPTPEGAVDPGSGAGSTAGSELGRGVVRGEASPGGTGTFYMGREIARVMGHRGAPWLERSERQEEERPDLLLDLLDLSPGDVVADIGAGSGYFTLPMARRVAPHGRVLAVDIQPEMLGLLEARAAEAGAPVARVVEPVLGTVRDPGLPEGVVDLVLLVDAYHEFSHPREMMLGLGRSLAPGGRVVLVEYRGEDEDLPIQPLHKMTEAQVRRELEAAGLTWVETIDRLPRQHVLVFERRAGGQKGMSSSMSPPPLPPSPSP